MSMLYTEQEKRIYGPYDNGSASVFGDPHKINRTLIRLLDGDPNRWFAAYRSDDVDEQSAAADRLVAAAIEAFELKPFDKTNGSGLMEGDILKILKHFSEWMKEVKKKAEPTPTGSSASAGLPEPPNPGNPGMPQSPAEKAFQQEKERDHKRLQEQMASLTRVGLPSG